MRFRHYPVNLSSRGLKAKNPRLGLSGCRVIDQSRCQPPGAAHVPVKINGNFVSTRFDLNTPMFNTVDYGLAVDLRKEHGINVAVEPTLTRVLRTLEDCHRVGSKTISALSLARNDRATANEDGRQQQHKSGTSDSTNA